MANGVEMYFTTFPVESTNIFPLSNTKNGGQLMTEWNIRSREMVSTLSSITYESGSSYVHGASDFEIKSYQSETAFDASTSIIVVSSGKGVFNGHFVQALNDMYIDLLEANAKRQSQNREPLRGELEIGIRVFYSTESTMDGAMLAESKDSTVVNMYEGVQIVVAPVNKLVTPEESPTDRTKVNCNLKLGKFIYSNGAISNVMNYSDSKLQYIAAERISNIEMLISDQYITKTGLNQDKLYTFAGKGKDPSTGRDTWTDSTSSLMLWDSAYADRGTTYTKPSSDAAFIRTNLTDGVYMDIPHMTVQGMTDAQGNQLYYTDKILEIPNADFSANLSGVVTAEYTKSIKSIGDKINEFYTTVKGKQVGYIATLKKDEELPPVSDGFEVGDYMLVSIDMNATTSEATIRQPSTMYVVVPGYVKTIGTGTQTRPSNGLELAKIISAKAPSSPSFFTGDEYRGIVGKDYFTYEYHKDDGSVSYTYYLVASTGGRSWSDMILVTGETQLAQDEVVGGFLNVNTDAVDGGYVYRDDYGHLRLVDYALLRSGTLAYQLGSDITLPNTLDNSGVQEYLDEFVNGRIAFKSSTASSTTDNPNVVNITFTLPQTDENGATINIYGIDSRFNTCVCFHILGTADANTTINFVDCQKLKIDNNIAGSPIINVYRSELYYDPYIMNHIRTCRPSTDSSTGMNDISLWYQRYEDIDANLVVDGMTVYEVDGAIVSTEVDYWNESNASNDNHYHYALKSITFSGQGDITECEIWINNETTANVATTDAIICGDFEIPQGSGLTYPSACMTKQLRITGTFVSAYKDNINEPWIVSDTSFTALSSVYDSYTGDKTISGTVAFHTRISVIPSVVSAITPWSTGSYHLFKGGAIS